MRGALRELRIGEASIQPGALQGRISLMKNRLMSSASFLDAAKDDTDELVGRAWKKYEEHLCARAHARLRRPAPARARARDTRTRRCAPGSSSASAT
jgi:hypothetical protein